jgi:pimeloyl-[acyl-carrier protein] methyl ester esterase
MHSAESRVLAIPGWATDGRIFALSAALDGITAWGEVTSERGRHGLVKDLETVGEPAMLVGWSLGGLVAAEIARTRPDLVSSLVLVGVRPCYPAEEVDVMRDELCSDTARCLRRFYQRCFAPSQDSYRLFRDRLADDYLRSPDEAALRDGLGYLAVTGLDCASLRGVRTVFVHGWQDAVAPVEEARSLAAEAGARFHAINGAGHAVFMSPDFGALVEELRQNG